MNERSYLILDLVRSKVLGLNQTESILASCLFGLLAQNPIQYAGKSYYMADYRNVSVYCPILSNKVDTLRRLYKSLEKVGLIQLIKLDNHVFFTPSQMLRDWGTVYKSVDAEKNPQTGIKSADAEKNTMEAGKNPVKAEKNPHYINNIINNINNYNNNNIDAKQKDFASQTPVSESKTKKTLFRNSEVAKMVKEGANGELDYSEFEEKFSSPEFANIDLVYYFHAVADWSDQKDMKRTKNGWLATVRNFIRGDAEKNKVKLKPQHNDNNFDMEGALKFLNNDF
jgi:hypothetical protein